MALAVVVVVGLAAAGVFVAEEFRHTNRYGTEVAVPATAGSRTAVEVDRGARFSLVVRENASIGDKWSVQRPPEPAVATADGVEYLPDGSDPLPGRGGARYFTFTAREPGTGVIGLHNCYRCSSAMSSTPGSYAAEVEVTVRAR